MEITMDKETTDCNDTNRVISESSILNKLAENASCGVPFGHFQLYYESIERVTDRRLALNRNNASLAILIAAGLGLVAGWAHDKPEVRTVALLVIFFLGILAAFFCRWWWRQIQDYKDLNGSKFDVLKHMAENIVLHEHGGEQCKFDPFYWEWKLSEARKTLTGWQDRLALGSSWSELVVPKAFLAFFAIVSISALGMLAGEIEWNRIVVALK